MLFQNETISFHFEIRLFHFETIITVEEHSPFGGLGSMVSQVAGNHCPKKIITMALPDAPVISGTSKEVFDYYGLNGNGIAKKALENL